MATLEIKDQSLVVTIEGIDKLFTFRSTISVPLPHIVGLAVRPDLSNIMYMPVETQFRGVRVPGAVVVGTLILADGSGNVFCDVRDQSRAIVIDLAHDQFKRLIVELTDQTPEEARARIEAALGHPVPSSTLAWEKMPDQPHNTAGGTSR
jgi:hypothetical protein